VGLSSTVSRWSFNPRSAPPVVKDNWNLSMITPADIQKVTEIETKLGLPSDPEENLLARIIRILKALNP
jgi:hypothetical protein